MINKTIRRISLFLIPLLILQLFAMECLAEAPSPVIVASQESSGEKVTAENKVDVIDGKCAGWIKKSSIDRGSLQFPYTANMIGDYIYSQPNTSETYQIGYGKWDDPVKVLYEENKNDIIWVHINFEEIYLLKNKIFRDNLISPYTKNIIGIVGAIIGAWVGSSFTNANDPKYLGAIVLYTIGGGIIGAMVSAFSVNVYNNSQLDKYHNESKEKSNDN